MNILITNDDGIYSPGLQALALVAREFGTVHIVAPDVEQSSMGHAITHVRPLRMRRTDVAGVDGLRVNGTPADCTTLGCHLHKIDVVLSGVNLGPNIGNSMWHSGTLAAAKQAALLGLRGIAISTFTHDERDEYDFDTLRPHIRDALALLLPLDDLALVNVNLPPDPRGTAWARSVGPPLRRTRRAGTRPHGPRALLGHGAADRGSRGRDRPLGGAARPDLDHPAPPRPDGSRRARSEVTGPSGPSLRAVAAAAMRENGFQPEFSPAVVAEVRALDESDVRVRRPETRDLRALLWSSIDNPTSRDLDQVEHAERRDDGAIRRAPRHRRRRLARAARLRGGRSRSDEHDVRLHGRHRVPHAPRAPLDRPHVAERGRGPARVRRRVRRRRGRRACRTRRSTTRSCTIARSCRTPTSAPGSRTTRRRPPRIAASAELASRCGCRTKPRSRLRTRARPAGALDFESVEASPVVANGKVIDLAVTQRNRARDLIEDFMVAANRCVATFLHANGSSSIRRVVREPERWDRIVAIAAEHGVTLPPEPDAPRSAHSSPRAAPPIPSTSRIFRSRSSSCSGPGAYVVEPAAGSDTDAGHFGLAVADYVHSTAPNRRFPDLVTQRMLRATWLREPAPYADDVLAGIAAHCTERGERGAQGRAHDAEDGRRGAARRARRRQLRPRSSPPHRSKGSYARVLSPPVEGRIMKGAQGLDVGDTRAAHAGARGRRARPHRLRARERGRRAQARAQPQQEAHGGRAAAAHRRDVRRRGDRRGRARHLGARARRQRGRPRRARLRGSRPGHERAGPADRHGQRARLHRLRVRRRRATRGRKRGATGSAPSRVRSSAASATPSTPSSPASRRRPCGSRRRRSASRAGSCAAPPGSRRATASASCCSPPMRGAASSTSRARTPSFRSTEHVPHRIRAHRTVPAHVV